LQASSRADVFHAIKAVSMWLFGFSFEPPTTKEGFSALQW
jgi:hypothetical protein